MKILGSLSEENKINISKDINRSSFGVILNHEGDKILLEKHPEIQDNFNKDYKFAGNWDLPGGGENNRRSKSEPRDINDKGHLDPQIVALREIKEEINLKPNLSKSPFLIGTTPGNNIHQVHYFEGNTGLNDKNIIADFKPSPEASKIEWFTYNEAIRLLSEPETPFSKHIEAITLLFALKESLLKLTELPILKIQKGPYGHQDIINAHIEKNKDFGQGLDKDLMRKLLRNIKFG